MTNTERLHTDIEQRLAGSMPDVELLSCERVAAERLRLFIDHPDGVSLALCEQVTRELTELLSDYALEVSSPGPQRPLTKPDHFRRFLGRVARVRTRQPRDGHKSFTGELVGATDDEVTVALDTQAEDENGTPGVGVISIPYAEISRSNLLERRGEEKR